MARSKRNANIYPETSLDACCKNNIRGEKKRMRPDIAQHRPDWKATRVRTQKVCPDVSHRKAETRRKFAENYFP
jgi:hypothetical protein